jgi:hypothetical protein
VKTPWSTFPSAMARAESLGSDWLSASTNRVWGLLAAGRLETEAGQGSGLHDRGGQPVVRWTEALLKTSHRGDGSCSDAPPPTASDSPEQKRIANRRRHPALAAGTLSPHVRL